MTVQQEREQIRLTDSLQIPPRSAARTAPRHGAVMTPTSAMVMAVVRLAMGFVFLWAFLDKTFGFGYTTPSKNAWLNGGSPTKGFLSGVEVGPMQSTFHEWAGQAWADWLFMGGLAGIAVALILGVALRIAALAGTVMMAFMWIAEWPLDKTTAAGEPSMSTNPIVDYHVIYAVVLVALAATYAGNTWGLGRIWARLPFVRRARWLI
ncbi:MAG TPA: DoxX family protein [Streptosporangiaceae bacterium]|nr:DoxX family protein [Streptosporangiaceae bacterium]